MTSLLPPGPSIMPFILQQRSVMESFWLIVFVSFSSVQAQEPTLLQPDR